MSEAVHWDGISLYDADYQVGQVMIIEKRHWRADPFWAEESYFFETQAEAKAWLVAMYKMGGNVHAANGPRISKDYMQDLYRQLRGKCENLNK